MIIELHMLKNFPPTNLNRDESGSPKTCFFGGYQRARISSQSLKRSWRMSPLLGNIPGQISVRTRKLPDLIMDELKRREVLQEYIDIAVRKVTGIGNKEGKENAKAARTEQVISYSPADIQALADIIVQSIEDAGTVKAFDKLGVKEWRKKIDNAYMRPITLDIALFGRMVTDESFANVEAAMQVAHAISIHKVNMESDFFTAVDDLVDMARDDVGSGMMGDIDFNSSCYYIYASLDLDQLRENLQFSPEASLIIPEVVPMLLETIAYTNPSGKQNSFAGHILPSTVYVEVKSKPVPVSLANAFSLPVQARGGEDFQIAGARALAAEIDSIVQSYGLPAEKRLWFSRVGEEAPQSAQKVASFVELLKELEGLL